MKYGRYGSNFTRSPAPPIPSNANTKGPTQHRDAMKAEKIEPMLAMSDQLRVSATSCSVPCVGLMSGLPRRSP